ncbi:hypothetical protein O181_104173 [Austropuccinia psidii MF-1]|uniref:Uncharacterized protein n=1 Tax=Austropuccinia psidii MF-1 TaxID=1389203 RepID=A0A9Q3JJN0_9BASI|nr:hypothetical protein [Austropuccinia psidii MF-1]
MNHSCNLEYGVHGGMERIPLKLRERLSELIWWLTEAMAGIMVHGQNWVLHSMTILVSKGFLAKIGSGGSNCGLGPRWLPPLASLADGPWTVNYGPQAVEAVGGLNGPNRPFRPKPP